MKKAIEIIIPTIFVLGLIGILILFDKSVSDKRETTTQSEDEIIISVRNQNYDTIYTETTTTSTNTTTTKKTTKKVLKTNYIAYDIQEEREYAKSLFSQYGWTNSDFEALINLWTKESNWNPNASNGTCYGIPQACPGSKMGKGYKTSWKVQINWGLGYIYSRYGTPTNAWQHFQKNNWY